MTHERFKNKSDRPSPAGRRPCSRPGAVPGMHMPIQPNEDRVGGLVPSGSSAVRLIPLSLWLGLVVRGYSETADSTGGGSWR